MTAASSLCERLETQLERSANDEDMTRLTDSVTRTVRLVAAAINAEVHRASQLCLAQEAGIRHNQLHMSCVVLGESKRP